MYRLGPGSGRSGQGVVREDEHVALVAEIAALLREAGQRQADYFGRAAAPLVEVCDEIVRSVDEQLPGIVAAVQQRNAAV